MDVADDTTNGNNCVGVPVGCTSSNPSFAAPCMYTYVRADPQGPRGQRAQTTCVCAAFETFQMKAVAQKTLTMLGD